MTNGHNNKRIYYNKNTDLQNRSPARIAKHNNTLRASATAVCLSLFALGAVAEEYSVFLAGDTIVMRPFATAGDDDLGSLVDVMRASDVAVVNLETLLHSFAGFPQADSGGTWMATSPEVAKDLAWAGIDMVSTANNHTFDYGAIGVLENLDALEAAGIVAAGSGPDLAAARASATYRTSRGSTALVSASATFEPYWAAGPARPDVHGRPGLNPLTTITENGIEVPARLSATFGDLARLIGLQGRRFDNEQYRLLGVDVFTSDGFGRRVGTRVRELDAEAFVDAIAARSPDEIVIAAVHAHRQGTWLQAFAHRTIDAGADIFIAHGPHEVRPIEIYQGRPIFYSLGDFFREQHHIDRLPADYYIKHDLPMDMPANKAVLQTLAKWDLIEKRVNWHGLAVVVTFAANGDVRDIRLLPTDLGWELPMEQRGRPRHADAEAAQYVIDLATQLSEPYGTEIIYDPNTRSGTIRPEATTSRQ